MKKLLLLFAFLLSLPIASVVANSENCRSNFLKDYKGDSRSFKIADEALVNDFDSRPKSYTIEAIKSLSQDLSDKSGLNCHIKISKSSCREVAEGIPSSMVCYLESEIGYFIVSKDMLSGVNIIFNRWD